MNRSSPHPAIRLLAGALTVAVSALVALAVSAPAQAAATVTAAHSRAASVAIPSAANQAAASVVAAATRYAYSCGEAPFNGYDGPNNIFTPACNYHDRCYWGGTHGFPFMGNRRACDETFRWLMYGACNNYQWWNVSCYATAELYYNIVRNVGWWYWAGNWWDNV